MAGNKGRDNRPEFSIAEPRHTDLTKDGDVWRTNVSALVKHRSNRPPSPAKEVVFIVNGRQVGSPRRTDELGRAEMDLVFRAPGRYYVEVQIVGTSFSNGTYITIEKAPKTEAKPHSIRTAQTEIKRGQWIVRFIVRDNEGKPVKGVVIEILDGALPDGSCELAPTDESGVASYTVQLRRGEKVRYFKYRTASRPYKTKRIWR